MNSSTQGLFEKIKHNLNPSYLKEQILHNRDILLAIIIFFGLGFLSGFFLKKFSHYCAAFIVLLLILAGLDYSGFIIMKIDWNFVQSTLGVKPLVPQSNYVEALAEWAQANFLALVSYAIGFFIGLRLA